ncbi:DUF1542 domain-containing protein [Limosilactobacillus portuensis]|uniref:DUF1542 domain-containing protein n=1 Tax=Limosilactobacillus portuensis TaxID=2742601 RepID=UPI0023596F3E|nr:DUF1542 domain-containing protein [Limosilactobacillus portuensis]WCT60519.1 DUF1542 domain-containing protein [Limosilactobacillus portuensis]
MTAKTDQATTESSAKTMTPAQSDDQTTAQAQTKTEDQASVDAKTDASDSTKTQPNADKQTATESKTDQASEDQAAKTNNDQATSTKKAAADDNASTTAKDQSTTTDQTAVKNEENNDAKANDNKTTNLSLTKGSVLKAQAAKASLVQTKAATNDEDTITVNTAQELIDAIQKGTATTINIGKNIDLGEKTSSQYTNTNISNKRNIIIQSADGKHYTVDFNGYGFNMYSNDYGVTFKDLDLYGRSYFGIVRSAGSYTFDNVNYTGSQLIYTDSGYNTTVNFDGNVTAHSVGSYTSPLNNKSQVSQGGNTQQVIQFAAGTNTINFNSGSNVTLTTTNSNVLEVDKGTTTINVKNGAQVSLNPHTQNGPEQLNGMSMDSIARGIASNGDTTLNIDQGGNLDINLTKNTEDKYLSGALYLNSGATINVNGNLNINSDGTPYYRSQGWDDPVYINGNAIINVNGGSFKANATKMGDYKGSVVTSNGNSTIAINHHGTFDVTGDGTQATGVSLGSGSTFTSTQPELFNISMPDGATAIKNGKVQFKGVKTSADGQPIGEIDITYASDGTPTVTKVTSYDEAATTATRTAGNNAKNKINLVAAGEEVNLSNVSFVKNADGTYTMSGNANTADNKGAYVYVSVNGTVHQVAPTDSQTLWTAGETGDPTSSQVPYTAETGTDGKFTVNLGKLKDTDQVSVYGAKDFVTSDTDTKTVSDWMTSSYRDQLQKLVDEAPTVEAGSNFTNATDNLKTTYTSAISDGSTLLQNSSATSEQLEAAANAITTAKTALNGDLNKVKQDLQAAVDAAPGFENTSATYYNATPAKQKAYTDAISAGSDALKAQNPTVESLTDALNKINDAKAALDGQPTNKQDLQAAVNNSKDVKDSNNYTNADQAAKTAYDDAVTAAQSVLDNKNATQAQVTQALQDLNTANGKLNGDAKTDAANRQALEDAVKDAPNVRNTPAYYNGDSKVQDAYNKAITDGQAVLDNKDATPAEVKNALDAITNAKKALDGQPTNKDALQDAVNKSKGIKDSNNYANADQNEKTAYDNAVTAAQGVLDNENATQAQVNQALKDLNTANSKLNGDAKTDAANRVALEEAVKEAPVVEKTYSKYYNGTEKAQNDYKNAVSEGQKVLDNPSATAAQIKTALDNINAAKDALDGDPTDKTTLQNGVDNAVDLDKSNADAQAKKAYTDALDKAKQVLADPNATQQAVKEANTALTNAKTALDNSSALQNAKNALQQAVDAKSTTEKTPAYYNANSDKQQAYNTAISAGTDALKVQNPTVESLTTELNKINEAKNALDGKATDTSKLKAAVDNANTVKASNDYKDASADYQKQYDDAVKAGQQLLDPTTAPSPLTQADVDRAAKAITDAQSALTTSATTNVKDAKEKATADLTTAVDAAKKAIDQDTNLTEDERNAAKAQVDQDASAAKEAINKATTNNAVTSAATAGKVTIDKTVANAAIDNAAAGKNKAIDGSSLTDEEKNGIKDQVAQAVKNAKGEISAADTEQKVTTAQKNGVDEINGIKVPSTSTQKDEAKGNINKAADDAKKEIDQDSNLTDDQKQAAKNQIDSDAKNAQKAIDDAKTDTDVNNAINGGKLAIDKTAANAAIDNAAAGKNKEIANSPLTTDEQNKLHDQVAKEVKTAKDNINSATIPTEVTTAKDNGVKAINGVKIPTTSPEKDKAKENLDKQVQDAKDAIDKDDNLTDDQKQAAKDQIDTDAKNAQDAIDNAKNDADVNNAADNGKLAIDKTVADAAIDNAVAGKIKDVKAPLTTDEQKTLTDLIKETGENAKQNIASATTPAEVTTAQENGVKAINDINVPTSSSVKDNATAAIDKANTAAKTAKDNINKATTNDAVKDAENNGVDSIKGITFTNLDDAKKAANNAIDNALTNKTNEINNASNLSQNEKQDLISKATDAATTAKDNIAKATTNDAVTDAQNKGIEAIANITVPSLDETKQKAINAIKQVQESKNKQISDAKNLNADQQKSLTDQVNKIADDAIAQINDSSVTTNDSVATICDNAIDQITNLFIPTLDGAQKDATNAIETAKNAKIDEINNAQNLSDQEKQDLTDQVNQAADDATKAIKDATTNDAVKDAETKGLNDINNIKVPSLAEKQQEAKNAVAKAADAKNQAIDNSNLTSDEKTALKKQVSAAQAAANKAIDDASTDAGVTKAQNDGIDNINKIAIPETSDAKAKATTDLKDAVDNAKKAIDQDTNLTNDQKQAAKDAIDQDAKTAQEAINNANTDSDVKKATDNGQLAIDKDVANAAIDNAAAGKKAEIAKSPLTDAEKQALDQQVDQQVQTAKSNIAKATTTDEVTTAQNNGIDNINNIKIPSVPTTNLTDAKNAANTAIDNAAAAKKNAIKAAQDAGTITAEQATDLNQQVDRAANEAKQAINNATTVSQVEQAQTSGIQTINNINIPSITDAKDAAKNAIDQAAKNKDAEIDASNLSDQEKADLKNEVKVIADTAKKSIDSVDNAAEVNNAMNAGIAAINSIKVATSSDNQNGQSGNNGSTIDNGSGEATNNNGSQAGSVTGATTSQSNGAKVSATGLNVKNNVNKQAAQLPQTGNQTNTSLGVVGLAAASLACLFGFTKLGKKKED